MLKSTRALKPRMQHRVDDLEYKKEKMKQWLRDTDHSKPSDKLNFAQSAKQKLRSKSTNMTAPKPKTKLQSLALSNKNELRISVKQP